MTQCICPQPGLCPLFQRQQSHRAWQICQGIVLTTEKCDSYRANWQAMIGQPAYIPIQHGPGTELRKLTDSLQIHGKCGGKCGEMLAKMNTWGVDGCREHRAEIVAHLAKAYHGLTWAEVSKAATGAVTSGLVLRIKPWDVCGSLVDLAIERAEALPGDGAKPILHRRQHVHAQITLGYQRPNDKPNTPPAIHMTTKLLGISGRRWR